MEAQTVIMPAGFSSKDRVLPYAHTHIHARTHADTQTPSSHARSHARTHAYTQASIHERTHARIRTGRHPSSHARTHAYAKASKLALTYSSTNLSYSYNPRNMKMMNFCTDVCLRARQGDRVSACVHAIQGDSVRVSVRASVYVSVCVCRVGRPSWIFSRIRFAEAPVAYPDTVSAPSIRLFGGADRFLS